MRNTKRSKIKSFIYKEFIILRDELNEFCNKVCYIGPQNHSGSDPSFPLYISCHDPLLYASGVLSWCFSDWVEGPASFICFISNPQWWSTWSYCIWLGHCSYDMWFATLVQQYENWSIQYLRQQWIHWCFDVTAGSKFHKIFYIVTPNF